MGSVTQNTVCLYSICRRQPTIQPPCLCCELVLVAEPLVSGEDLAPNALRGKEYKTSNRPTTSLHFY